MSGFLGFDPIASGAFSAPPTPSAPVTAVTGTLSQQLDALTISASGTVDTAGIVNGSANITVGDVTVDADGSVGVAVNVVGTITGTTETMFVTSSGSVGAPLNITGTLSETIDNVSISAVGNLGEVTFITGTASGTLSDLRGYGSGAIGEVTTGTINITLDDVSIVSDGVNVTAPSGTLAKTFTDLTVTATGVNSGGIGFGWETALQFTLYNVLNGNAYLQSLVTDIFDEVPQETSAFPFVVIGEAIHNEWNTDTDNGNEVSVTIHTWSRHRGRKEIKAIQHAIYLALHRQSLAITGYNFISCDFQDSQTFIENDGKTRHGVQTFKVLIDQQEEG